MFSRGVIAEGTSRLSSSNTFWITASSCGAITPAAVPAPTLARMSSEVIVSWRFVGIPSERMQASDKRSSTKTIGRSTRMMIRIGRTTRMAIASGRPMARRFGRRSAKMTKSEVASRNESAKLTCFKFASGTTLPSAHEKKGEKAASPTMPPKRATALMTT